MGPVAALLLCSRVARAWLAPSASRRPFHRAAGGAGADDWPALWESLASDEELRRAFGKSPLVLRRAAKGCRITLGALGDCVDADATSLDDAARVVSDGGTWSNSELSDGDGPFERVLASMRGRTVLFNHAGAAFPSLLGPACAAALDAFELPVGVNVYCSGSGLETSAPPHSDRQEVFVVQCSGRKRWVVYEPPAVDVAPDADPFSRGKGGDALDEGALTVVFDDVLNAGDVLYVPAGAPHATSTTSKSSLHLTFGVVCSSNFGLSVDSLRVAARSARPSGDPLDDPAALRELDPALYAALDAPLPLGRFLGRDVAAGAFEADAARALGDALAREPLAAYRAGLGFEAPDAAAVADAARRIAAHHGKLLDEQRRAYAADAAAEPASSRVAAHLDALGALVDDLWTAGRASGLAARIAGAKVVVRDRPRAARGDDVPG